MEEVTVEEPDNKENEDNFTVNYDTMPTKAEELDDCEFIVYAELRTWRLLKSLELDIEPYRSVWTSWRNHDVFLPLACHSYNILT